MELLNYDSSTLVQELSLTGSQSYSGVLSPGYIPAGNYVIGFHDDGPTDPSFSLVFDTPVIGTPEPSSMSMFALGAFTIFAGVLFRDSVRRPARNELLTRRKQT